MSRPFIFRLAADVGEWLAGARETTDSIEEIADELEKLEDTDIDLDKALQDGTREAMKLTDQLEDSAQELEDLGKAGKDAGDDIEEGFEGAGKAGDEFGESAEDALDGVADAAEQTGQETEESLSEGFEGAGNKLIEEVERMDQASEGAGEKFKGAWGDALSDFDGTVEGSVQTGINGLLAFAGSAGLAGAAGSMLAKGVTSVAGFFVDKWKEAAEETEARNRQMYEQMLANADAYFSGEQVMERFHQIMNRDDDAPLIDYLDDYVTYTELSMQEIALAIADPRSDIADALAESLDANALQMHASGATAAKHAFEELRGATEETSDAIQSNTEFLEQHGVMSEDAAEAARDWASAQAEAAAAQESTIKAIEGNIEAAGSLADATLENSAVLAEYADDLIEVQGAADAAGQSSGSLTALQYEQAVAFVEAAAAAGIGTDAALDLAVQYGLIPEEVATDIQALGVPQAKSLSAEMKASIDNIPKSVSTAISVVGDLTQAANEVNRIERSLRTITIGAGIAAVRGSH